MPEFDEEYYARFYESKKTRVYGKKEIARLARAITSAIAWYGGEIHTALDVGAGTGLWRDWFRVHKPAVRYRSTEVSAYACETYGHEQRDIATWKAPERFDLVICQGVLPYLDDDAIGPAIENLAAMSRGFFYVEAITKKDLDEVCDRDLTDTTVHARSAGFYRSRLALHWRNVGGGLYYSRKGPLQFYELEVGD